MFDRRTFMQAVAATATVFTFASFAGAALAADPVVIKFSHVVAPDTPKGKGADKFKELAERYTAGAVKVEIYPNSQLYKDKEELEALQLGAVQMLAPSLAKFGPLGIKDFEVFDLPYIFPDYDALHSVTQGPIGMAFWDNGFKIMSANSPIKTPDDFLGLKMRIQSSKVLEAEINALGAVPQVMAFSEVYQALQTGVVDGTENPPSNMYTQKMHEVQKYATISNHGYLGYAVIVNAKFWNELPADVRGNLEKAMAEATDYANAIARQENEKALVAMKASGKTEFHEMTADELAAWGAVLIPVQDEMAERIGTDLVRRVQETTGVKK